MSAPNVTATPVSAIVGMVESQFKETKGGRVIGSLAISKNANRQKLARDIAAAITQDALASSLGYLAEQAGDALPDGAEPARKGIDPNRPRYVRPNGETYYARKWGNFWDVEVLRKARAEGEYVLLLGEPGTGKTAMAEAAFGDDLITTVLTGQTEVSGLVGSFVPDGIGGYRWSRGPLQIAVEEGRPIFIDEILMGDPEVLVTLYPLMDGRGFLDVSDNHEIGVINAADGFYIIGSGNPNVPGAKLSPALSDRFDVHVDVSTDYDLLEALGVDERVVSLASTLAAGLEAGRSGWAPQFRSLMKYKKLKETWGEEFALKNLIKKCPPADRDEVRALARTNQLPMDHIKPAKI